MQALDIDAEPLTWREFVRAHLHEVEIPPRGPRGSTENYARSVRRGQQMRYLGDLWREIQRLRRERFLDQGG